MQVTKWRDCERINIHPKVKHGSPDPVDMACTKWDYNIAIPVLNFNRVKVARCIQDLRNHGRRVQEPFPFAIRIDIIRYFGCPDRVAKQLFSTWERSVVFDSFSGGFTQPSCKGY